MKNFAKIQKKNVQRQKLICTKFCCIFGNTACNFLGLIKAESITLREFNDVAHYSAITYGDFLLVTADALKHNFITSD